MQQSTASTKWRMWERRELKLAGSQRLSSEWQRIRCELGDRRQGLKIGELLPAKKDGWTSELQVSKTESGSAWVPQSQVPILQQPSVLDLCQMVKLGESESLRGRNLNRRYPTRPARLSDSSCLQSTQPSSCRASSMQNCKCAIPTDLQDRLRS